MNDHPVEAARARLAERAATSGGGDDAMRRHTIASDDVSVLNRLIDHGMLAIAMRPNREHELVRANLEMVGAAAARPSDGNRAICQHTAMFASAVYACDAALHRQDLAEAEIYARVIGALFPDVRRDASRALQNRMRVPA